MKVRNIYALNVNYTIGWSVYNLNQEYFQIMQQGVIDRATELGMEVLIKDQKGSTAEMISGVNDLITQGIHALVISPFNPEAMPAIVAVTKQMNIPVVVVDVGTGGADVDAFIVSDNFGGGVLAAEYALRLVNERGITSQNVAIIKVEITSVYANRRGEAFSIIMRDSGYTVAAEERADSLYELAYVKMERILNTVPDLAVVFAENDSMALGAAQAIADDGKKGQIMVIGFNGEPSAVEAILNGFMQGTIAQQPYEMGSLGAEIAYNILTGQPVRYDDRLKRELYVEVYLINENGVPIYPGTPLSQ